MDIYIYILIGAALLIALGYWLLSRSREREPEESSDDRPDGEGRADAGEAPRAARTPKAEPKRGEAEPAKAERSGKPGKPEKPPKKVEEAKGEEPAAEGDDEAASDEAAAEEEDGSAAPPSAAKPGPARPSAIDEEARKERRSAFRKGLKTTRGGFIAKLGSLLKGKREVDKELLDSLEEVMLTADVGVRFTEKLKGALETSLSQKELDDEATVWEFMRDMARDIVAPDAALLDVSSAKPFVIMVVGVNGVGKTTTIAKLASRYVKEGKKVVLAAGDTFRAAAVRQLEMWGDRVGAEVVKDDKQGADPASVTFKAVERAREVGADVVIADTAGRLHTKTPLMDELKKVKRVMGKALDGAPHEVLLVLDSNTGQNANQQTREFNEALGVTGLVLTKLDGTAKGGVILGICEEHRIPVRFVGVGERDDDLREFDPEDFVDVLFERPGDDDEAAA